MRPHQNARPTNDVEHCIDSMRRKLEPRSPQDLLVFGEHSRRDDHGYFFYLLPSPEPTPAGHRGPGSRTPPRWCQRPRGSCSGLFRLLSSGGSHGSDLAIDITHAERTGAAPLGFVAQCFVRRRRRGNILDEIFNAHNDHRRFAAAVNHKALTTFLGSFEDLSQLSASGDSRNSVGHAFDSLLHCTVLGPLNQFSRALKPGQVSLAAVRAGAATDHRPLTTAAELR